MDPTQSIRDLAEPLVVAAGHELWDVEVSAGIVRILVDRPAGPGAENGGIDLDSLAAASQAISAALDDREDLVPGPRYHLEVSSPGVERTLRTLEHYRRFVGSEVSIKLTEPVGGSRRWRGVLVDATDTGVRVRVSDAGPVPPAETALDYAQIQRAHTVFVWGPIGPKGHQQGPAGSGGHQQGPAGPKGHHPGRAKVASRPRPLTGSATNPKDPS